jgi:hypothetical protein
LTRPRAHAQTSFVHELESWSRRFSHLGSKSRARCRCKMAFHIPVRCMQQTTECCTNLPIDHSFPMIACRSHGRNKYRWIVALDAKYLEQRDDEVQSFNAHNTCAPCHRHVRGRCLRRRIGSGFVGGRGRLQYSKAVDSQQLSIRFSVTSGDDCVWS